MTYVLNIKPEPISEESLKFTVYPISVEAIKNWIPNLCKTCAYPWQCEKKYDYLSASRFNE